MHQPAKLLERDPLNHPTPRTSHLLWAVSTSFTTSLSCAQRVFVGVEFRGTSILPFSPPLLEGLLSSVRHCHVDYHPIRCAFFRSISHTHTRHIKALPDAPEPSFHPLSLTRDFRRLRLIGTAGRIPNKPWACLGQIPSCPQFRPVTAPLVHPSFICLAAGQILALQNATRVKVDTHIERRSMATLDE